MATPVVESSATGTTTPGSSLTITKPTGLAVDDLMVFIGSCTDDDPAQSPSITTKSGWTLAESATGGGTHSNIQYRVADSADVAASNFSWTTSGTGGRAAGGILRVTNYFASPIEESSFNAKTDASVSDTALSLSGTATITVDDCLICVAISLSDTSSTTPATSNYGSTPSLTFTELYDTATTGAHCAGVYAISPTDTNVTAFTCNISTGQSDNHNISVVAIRPYYPIAGTAALHTPNTTLFAPAGRGDTNATASLHNVSPTIPTQSGTVTPQATQWTQETKPSTTWTQES